MIIKTVILVPKLRITNCHSTLSLKLIIDIQINIYIIPNLLEDNNDELLNILVYYLAITTTEFNSKSHGWYHNEPPEYRLKYNTHSVSRLYTNIIFSCSPKLWFNDNQPNQSMRKWEETARGINALTYTCSLILAKQFPSTVRTESL